MKKSYLIILSIAFILSIGMITLILLITIPRNTPKNVANEQSHFTSNLYSSQESSKQEIVSSNVTTMTSQSDVYTVKAYNNHIGIFLNNEAEPFREFNIALNNLPAEDQELLKKGITAKTLAELQLILEDYIS